MLLIGLVNPGMVTSAVIADGLKSCFTAGVDSKIFAWELPPLLLDPYAIRSAIAFSVQLFDLWLWVWTCSAMTRQAVV